MNDTSSDRDPLEALAAEFIERHRWGESPAIKEYADRHPELAGDIYDLFPTIVSMENLKVEKEQSARGSAFFDGIRLERLGDFRIIEELGRGGMGIVYEAEQESLGRHVAVKVLPRQMLLDPKQLERFAREAQTAAQLHHTNIVPIFGVGEYEGYHYFVMQLIRGIGLDEVMVQLSRLIYGDSQKAGWDSTFRSHSANQRTSEVVKVARELFSGQLPLADAERVEQGSDEPTIDYAFNEKYWQNVGRIGLQVADALKYAHAQGTLHRDIKPGNLLIDEHGNTWVADFGLAKAIGQDELSQPGAVVGTLRYMASERFSGESDVRSDIYSLGLTLYELITLRPAFGERDRNQLIKKITDGAVIRPGKLSPQVPRDLETIVLKAIERDPDHRYQSAGELAADLQCFLEDRPIKARQANLAERAWRWSRRNRAVACLSATALALLVTVAIVTSIGYVNARNANIEINRALHDVSRQREKAEATTVLAMEVLDTIFDQLAPDRVVSASDLTIENSIGQEVELESSGQPALTRETARLLENMLKFYDRLAEPGDDDLVLREKVANASRRLGDIHRKLGAYEQAKNSYLKAVSLFDNANIRGDSSPGVSVDLARIYNQLCNTYEGLGDFESAYASLEKAKSILEADGDQLTPDFRYELARTCFALGRRGPQDLIAGPNPDGRGLDGAGPDSMHQPPGRDSRNSPQQYERGGKIANLTRAIEILEDLVNKHPSVPDYKYLLALCYREMPPESPLLTQEKSMGKAREILEKLAAEFPTVAEYRYGLSETYVVMALNNRADKQNQDEIESLLVRALAISDELVKGNPNIPDYVRSQVWIRHSLGRILQRRSPEAALTHLEKALELQHDLVNKFPEVMSYRVWMAIVRESLAMYLADGQELEKAKDLLEHSISDLEKVIKVDPEQGHVPMMLAGHYRQLGHILHQLGQENLAFEAMEKGRQVITDLRREEKKLGLQLNTDEAFQGYTLFAPLQSTTTYLVNMAGKVVHRWESETLPGQAVYLLENGNLLRCGQTPHNGYFHGGGVGGLVQEIDRDSNVVWEFSYADSEHCQHHDIEPLPNGNVLVLAWERNDEDDLRAAGFDLESSGIKELWTEHIIEVKPEGISGGEIVWQWHLWDHLVQEHDATKNNYGAIGEHPELIDVNYSAAVQRMSDEEFQHLQAIGYIGGDHAPRDDRGAADWNHANSISYNPELDQIAISVLKFNEIWVIDHSTNTQEAASHSGGNSGKGGDILFRWGNPQTYLAGNAEDQQLFAQHDASWIPSGYPGAGNVLIFNNGKERPGDDYSSVMEISLPLSEDGSYAIDLDSGIYAAKTAWSYQAPNPRDFYSGHISGVQRLPNGNTLICSGEQGRIFEVNRKGQKVWEYNNPYGDTGPDGIPDLDRFFQYPPEKQSGIAANGDMTHRLGPLADRNGPPGPGGQLPPRLQFPKVGMQMGHHPPQQHGEENSVFRATRIAPDFPGLSDYGLKTTKE